MSARLDSAYARLKTASTATEQQAILGEIARALVQLPSSEMPLQRPPVLSADEQAQLDTVRDMMRWSENQNPVTQARLARLAKKLRKW
ncbi:MAG: hypothetical protein ABSE16_06025 [Verrucomicrobiota bacterium]|jgi:hypothetical protein